MEVWKIVVPAVITVVVAILGYVFGRWNFDRSRRASIHDRNIQEARDYIDGMTTMVSLLEQFERILREESTMSGVNDSMMIFADDFKNLPLIMKEQLGKTGIEILKDHE